MEENLSELHNVCYNNHAVLQTKLPIFGKKKKKIQPKDGILIKA